MPEKRTTLSMSIPISVSASCKEASIPKSPQPGHQSLNRSVLTSVSLSTMGQHHPPVLSRSRNHQLDRLIQLIQRYGPSVILDYDIFDHNSGFFRNNLGHLSRIILFDIDDYFARERYFFTCSTGNGLAVLI